ncbi:MAG: hypothetical protein JXA14_16060 [Anaerolineae bacterium]|nr:hypothetical protein [Anaerolineae bacterium]
MKEFHLLLTGLLAMPLIFACAPIQTSPPSPIPTASPQTLIPTLTSTPIPTLASIRLKADDSKGYATLEEAIRDAPEGSTLVLDPGTYRLEEPLEIRKPLHLAGAGMDERK